MASMTDPRVVNLARILVQYSTKVQPQDQVIVVGDMAAVPLIREVYREVLRAGAFCDSQILLEGRDYIDLTESNDDQLQHISPVMKMVMETYDVMIFIRGETNTLRLSNVDPGRQKLRAASQGPLMKAQMERSAVGDFRWTLAIYPTHAYAQNAEMSLEEFADYVFSCTYADTDDPVAQWQAVHDMQQRLIDWLDGKKDVRVTGPNVDLSLSIEGRVFKNSDGDQNMPSGEIYTGPVEDSVNGWIKFTYPAILTGREAEGVELHFEDGKVVKATAERGEEFLLSVLDTDEGARYVGEFAIGTNKRIDRFIKNILFDEKMGDTIHLALGAGYPETGSKNQSAIHWDMLCDMRDGGKITVDGELFYESGEFKI
jgi:aminopeptidase